MTLTSVPPPPTARRGVTFRPLLSFSSLSRAQDVIVGCCDYNPAGNVEGEFVTNVMRKNTLPSPVGSGPASVFLPVPVLLRTEKDMWLIAHNER